MHNVVQFILQKTEYKPTWPSQNN